MKRFWRKFFAVLLFVFIAAVPASQASAAGMEEDKNAATTVASGSCGETAKFVLDSNGLLKITGSGTVDDNSGWNEYLDQIQKVEVSGPSKLGSWLFGSHTNLKSIVLGNSVEEIGAHCFAQSAYESNTVLESVQIGKGIKEIGVGAFYGARGLKKVYISDLASWCSVDIDYSREHLEVDSVSSPLGYGAELILNGETVTDLTVPDTVTRIGTNAFFEYQYLTSVVIPASVTKMGVGAFGNTPKLETVRFLGHAPEPEVAYYYGSMTYANGAFCGNQGFVTIYQPLDDTTYTNFARFMYSSTYSIDIEPDDDPNEDWPDVYLLKKNVSYVDKRITWAEWNSEWFAHGGCGENASWILDKNGWLWISGTGEVNCDAYKYHIPYYSVGMIVVGEGITSIADYDICWGSNGVWLPKSLQHIHKNFEEYSYSKAGFYYQGSEEDWSLIEIDEYNDALKKDQIAYHIESPEDIVFATSIKTDWDPSGYQGGYERYTIPTQNTMKLTASVEPSNATIQKIVWKSYDPEIASVDENGLVTAHTYGYVTIQASAVGYGEDAYCYIRTLYYDVAGSPNKGDDNYQYFFTPVYWAADNGITKGYGNVYFGPDENCTREQMITFLYRTAGSPKVSGSVNFSDVKKGTYYYNAVLWAYQQGITKGYTSGPNKGKFGVGLNVTREDTVTFIYRMAGKPKYSTNKSFSDVVKGKYYYDAVRWAAQNKITNGYADGTFGVGKDVLRKDIVTFLYRYTH